MALDGGSIRAATNYLTDMFIFLCTVLFTQTEHANKLSSVEVYTNNFSKAYHKYLYPIISPGQNTSADNAVDHFSLSCNCQQLEHWFDENELNMMTLWSVVKRVPPTD